MNATTELRTKLPPALPAPGSSFWTGLESEYLTTLYSIEDCQRHYGL